MRRIFAQIFANFPVKSKENDTQKKTRAFHWVHFSSEATSSTIFSQILPKLGQISHNLPQNYQITKDVFTFILGVFFIKSTHIPLSLLKVYAYFAQISSYFVWTLRDSVHIFTKSKYFGCGCTPCTCASCTSREESTNTAADFLPAAEALMV